MQLLHGDIIFSAADGSLLIHENSYLAVERGLVEGIYPVVPESFRNVPIEDYGRDLIIPAFSDLHIHAPQYAQRGTGMDLLLSDWLSRYTFPEEAKFADIDYARTIYTQLAADMLRQGTFHAAVYATIHNPASRLLADILEKSGMRGFVGKVNMDCSSPDYLCETTEQSLRDTEDFLASFGPERRVRPILTPRFAPTCSRELINGLGRLGQKYGVGMQTHIVESRWEAAEAVRLFPECSCDTEIYKNAGLLGNGPSLLGHFIFPSAQDYAIAEACGALAVHCPEATCNIIAGIAPVSATLRRGIAVGIGSDVGAGQSPAIYRQIAAAVRISKLRAFYEGSDSPALSFPTAFFMATRQGGSLFGKVGAFEPGYEFDALVLTGLGDEGTVLSPAEALERFCYIGDDRNIAARYIRGEKL